MMPIKLTIPAKEVRYRSGFWNEEPNEAMQPPYTPPGRCVLVPMDNGGMARRLADGCYLSMSRGGGD